MTKTLKKLQQTPIEIPDIGARVLSAFRSGANPRPAGLRRRRGRTRPRSPEERKAPRVVPTRLRAAVFSNHKAVTYSTTCLSS